MPSSSVQRTTSVRTMTSIQPTEPTLSERRGAENGRNNTSILKDFVAMDGWTINDHRTHPKTHPKSWWQKATNWMSFEFLPRWQTRGAYLSCFGWRMSLFFCCPFFFHVNVCEGIQTSSLWWSSNISRTNGTNSTIAGNFLWDWGWWEKHGIEIKDGGFFRFRRLTKSCVQLVTRMHIPSNMFKHHQWIMISSTYPQYFGHIPYHWWCDFAWQWLNNQKHQKANVHQNVHQISCHINVCFSLTQLGNQTFAMVLPSESLESPWSEPELPPENLSLWSVVSRFVDKVASMVLTHGDAGGNRYGSHVSPFLVKDWNQG